MRGDVCDMIVDVAYTNLGDDDDAQPPPLIEGDDGVDAVVPIVAEH